MICCTKQTKLTKHEFHTQILCYHNFMSFCVPVLHEYTKRNKVVVKEYGVYLCKLILILAEPLLQPYRTPGVRSNGV